MASKQRWKQAEREAASMLGTTRIPNNGYGQPDFVVPSTDTRPQIACQVKTKAALPAWFSDAVAQSVLDAEGLEHEAVPAVVIVHAPGSGIKKRRYMVLRFEDAVTLLTDSPMGEGV